MFHLGPDARVSKTNRHLLKHPQILLSVDDEYGRAYFGVCSTDKKTRALLKRLGKDEIVIDLVPDGRGAGNGLDDPSFVNCDEIKCIDIEALEQDYLDGVLHQIGIISENDYSRIGIASLESDDAPDIYDSMSYRKAAF